jgi:SAM-dependent methyltransferase
MMPVRSETEGYIEYLAAKKAIDDRSLNRLVWSSMQAALGNQYDGQMLRILEIGCGIGTMAERFLLHWTAGNCEYIGVDLQPEYIKHAQGRFPAFAAENGFTVETPPAQAIFLQSTKGLQHRVQFEQADVLDLPETLTQPDAFDLIISHAFLDLVEIDEVVPSLFQLLHPAGYFYFSMVFDGLTEFLPLIDEEFDAKVIELYHRSMDKRLVEGVRSGHSQTGRRLYGVLHQNGASVQSIGASDWAVKAQGEDSAENLFLRSILEMVQDELLHHPELDTNQFQSWIELRKRQIDEGELVYIAHQLDYFGQKG